jgi:hypothetical protein
MRKQKKREKKKIRAERKYAEKKRHGESGKPLSP